MIAVIILGLVVGLAIGFGLDISYPTQYTFYMVMVLLAAIDSIIGAVRASLAKEYDNLIFISGFVINGALAVLLAFAGDRTGIPLYYATIVVFGIHVFANAAKIREIMVEKYYEKKSKKAEGK